MTEIVTSGSMSGVGKRSDGAAYTGTKPETADTAKASTWTPPRPASTLLRRFRLPWLKQPVREVIVLQPSME